MQVGRMHNLQKSGHNSREIPTGELYELHLVNSGSFTKQKNPPQMKYTVPIVEVNYNQEDLPLFYMYISLNVLQSI